MDLIKRPLLLATLASIVLHAYLLYRTDRIATHHQTERTLIEVALAPKVIKPSPVVQPPIDKPKKNKPKQKKTKSTLKQAAKPVPTPSKTSEPLLPKRLHAQADPVASTIAPAQEVSSIATSAEPARALRPREPVDTTLPIVIDEKPEPYNQVTANYDVYADPSAQSNRASLGSTFMHYQRKAQTYQLQSEVHATGLMSLFLSDLVQVSRGAVTENGLQPNYFLYQYDDKKREATFDWAKQAIELKTNKGTQQLALRPGTQDLLSFLFQFMFVSPLDQTSLMVTNGKALSRYDYAFIGEERTATAAGIFSTVHIVREDTLKNEQLSLWLAIDYQYLPVKIKQTKPNKNKTYELIIRKLQTDQGKVQGDAEHASSTVQPMDSLAEQPAQGKIDQPTMAPQAPFNPLIQR